MKIFNKKNKSNDDGATYRKLLSVSGNASDLFEVNKDGAMKQTRLFYLIPDDLQSNNETFDICVTSTNPHMNFPIFDQMLDKDIRITIEIKD